MMRRDRISGVLFACLWIQVFAGPCLSLTHAQSPQFKLENPESGYATGSMGSVVVDGDTMIVGAPNTDPSGLADAGIARVYLKDSMGGWNVQAELIASDGAANDRFGSVSLSGDTAVVGAWGDDGGSGSAYVFVRSGTAWTQQAKLIASDRATNDFFGGSVSISGDTAIVGASGDDNGAQTNSGSAYVFTRNGSTWTQQQKLTASDATTGDFFGSSVSVASDTTIVGAYGSDGVGSNSGAAYVFTRSGSAWTQQQKLTASDAAAGDYFAISARMSGDTAILGASGKASGAGAAYVFACSGSTWYQQNKLVASDAAASDGFGGAVAISGSTAIIGASSEGGAVAGYNSGAAYVFTFSGSTWTQKAELIASDAAGSDRFGSSVSISADTAVIGSPGDDDGGTDSGSVYVFARHAFEVWGQHQKLNSVDSASGDAMGRSVSVSGDTAIVGASGDKGGLLGGVGSVHVFTRNGSAWTRHQKLTPSPWETAEGDAFGSSVSISGDEALIGAPLDDEVGSNAGSAYVFARGGLPLTDPLTWAWSGQQKVGPSDPTTEAQFGASVSLSSSVSGATAVIGAPGLANASGAAYVFTRSGNYWSQQAKLMASDMAVFDIFGVSVSISGDTAVVGAPLHDGMGADSGSAYVFVRNGLTWTQQTRLTAADAAANDYFGCSVSISGDTIVIGAYGDSGASGSTYVFTRSGLTWTQQAKLTASDAAANDWFGISVSVSSLFPSPFAPATVVVGAQGDDGRSGSAYVFTRNGATWAQYQKLTPLDRAANDYFGSSVATDAMRTLVGAYAKDDPETDSGAAYVFSLIPDPVPTDLGVLSTSTDSITVGWTDASNNEAGFKVYADTGSGTPATLRDMTGSGAVSWTYSGLGPNQQHTFQIAASNAFGDSEKTGSCTTWTLASTPSAPTVDSPGDNVLNVAIADDDNPTTTEYSIRNLTTGNWLKANGSSGTVPVWQTRSAWGTKTTSGLTRLTAYSFAVTARNGTGVETPLGLAASASTLPVRVSMISLE